MKRNFPIHFSACQLRTSSQISWMYATYVYTISLRELREANQIGWFYAMGGCRKDGDKAGFHAIAPIGGIDGKP